MLMIILIKYHFSCSNFFTFFSSLSASGVSSILTFILIFQDITHAASDVRTTEDPLEEIPRNILKNLLEVSLFC